MITKDMKISKVIEDYPQTEDVFMKQGFFCISCVGAEFESIEQGAMAHGISVDELLKTLNNSVSCK